MITERDKAALHKLLFSNEWKVVENLIEETIAGLQAEPKAGDNEFDTLRNVFRAEGGERALRRFVQRITEIGSQHE